MAEKPIAEAATEDEIEITEAMIEAGHRASALYDQEDPKSWEIAAIYRAMEQERRKATARDCR